MNFTCPNCEMENAYLEIVDEAGAHYTCPDCDFEWSDDDNSLVDNEEEGEELIIQFKNCPNCLTGGNKYIYKCTNCQFQGCYDEYHLKGCFENTNHKVECPKCNICEYDIVGRIGTGWDEPFNEF